MATRSRSRMNLRSLKSLDDQKGVKTLVKKNVKAKETKNAEETPSKKKESQKRQIEQKKTPPKVVMKKSKTIYKNNTNMRTSTPKIKKLRSRKAVKYNESSLEVTKSKDSPEVKKVPIYKQNIVPEKTSKRKKDQYEFDSDSEKYKKRKRRKLDDSDSYNETIQNILKKIVNRRKTKRQVIYSDQKNKAPKKGILKRNDNEIMVREIVPKINTNIDAGVVNIPNGRISSPQQNLRIIPEKRATVNAFKNQDSQHEYMSSDDEYFVEKSPSKIKVLSNVQLNPQKELNLSMKSPRFFKGGEPDANSTMVNLESLNVLTPWRFNQINITRNPHFITLKQSALPCISQEMVLDHTTVNKLNESSKIVEKTSTENTKKPVQATIDDYFGGKKDENNKENQNGENLEMSLFDNDMFSPIKSPRRSCRNPGSAKRKILCEKNENSNESLCENVEESISPAHGKKSQTRDIAPEIIPSVHGKNNKNSDESLCENVQEVIPPAHGKKNYFGFDSDDESNIETPATEKNERPFRLSVSINDKKYQKKRKVNFKKVEILQSSSEESASSSDEENENEGGIFEDFKSTQELIANIDEKTGQTVVMKSKRKNGERQKRRKDVRSKEEEEEAEKWAAAFNSMCEEVEQFPLEIE